MQDYGSIWKIDDYQAQQSRRVHPLLADRRRLLGAGLAEDQAVCGVIKSKYQRSGALVRLWALWALISRP